VDEANIVANLLSSFPLILPEIALVATACLVYIGGTLLSNRHVWAGTALAGVAIASLLVPVTLTVAVERNVFVSPLLGDSLAPGTVHPFPGAGGRSGADPVQLE
jgi:hypothetical protein